MLLLATYILSRLTRENFPAGFPTKILCSSLFFLYPSHLLSLQDHHHKHEGLDPLIRSVSRAVVTALANVSSVFQLFSFLVDCRDMISKGFSLVAFFASVKPVPSVFIYLVQYVFSL
jgi:hypothetical protein